MSFKFPNFLVDSDWLEKNLEDPKLRIIDCHYYLDIKSEGNVTLTSGRDAWKEAHIPKSTFIDLLKEVSDPDTDLPFMMPSSSRFAEMISKNGINGDKIVVIYDRGGATWASRLWWMLYANGFDNMAILNGGWKKWQDEGRPQTTESYTPPSAKFITQPRPFLIVDKEHVLQSIDDKNVIRICALDRELFLKEHIPGSLNISAKSLIDPYSNKFLPVAQLESNFNDAGASKNDRIIVYCGGGIASACLAFAMTMVGYENVALYDGALEEWKRDPDLPLTRERIG